MPKVFLIKPGSILRDESGRILDARSSVTLIESGYRRIVVDTGMKGEEELILRALAELGLESGEIDAVINTHSHPDHCGNNHLFTEAEVLAPGEGETVAPGVAVMETPGHTLDSISVAAAVGNAKEKAMIVVAGDALPTLGNFQKNVPPASHVDRDLAISSMGRIIRIADVIIPGHDHPFSVKTGGYLMLPNRQKCRVNFDGMNSGKLILHNP